MYFGKLLATFSLLLLFPLCTWAKVPTDPKVNQWSFRDTKAFEAWDLATGSRDVIVAVIDNGFDTFHPDLYPNVWRNEDEVEDNRVDDDHNGYIDDVWGWDFVVEDKNDDGKVDINELAGDNDPRPDVIGLSPQEIKNGIFHHGSLVAGIIGAVGNNAQDIAGINWQVRLMNIRMLNSAGTGDLLPLSRAIRYAVDNGAQVINFSIIGSGGETELLDAINYAYSHRVVMVAAAGNNGLSLNEEPLYPVCSDGSQETELILGVSGVDEQHHLANFSNYGSTCIDLAAPGVGIESLLRYAPRFNLPQTSDGGWNGTSFAAPFVSGAAALVKSVQPSWGPQEIFSALLSTVHKTPPPDENVYKNLFGAGLLQIDKAVEYAKKQTPVVSLTASRVFSLNAKIGVVTATTGDGVAVSSRVVPLLLESDDVSVNQSGSDPAFAVAKSKKFGQREMYLLTRDWQVFTSWVFPAAGPVDVEFGDVTGDTTPEVVVGPSYADKNIVRVFSIGGKELARYDISTQHAGVSIALTYDPARKTYDIVAGYREKNTTYLVRLSGDVKLQKQITVPELRSIGSVGSADVNGDAAPEYVVSAGRGESPWVIFYDQSGSLERKFAVYDTGYQQGVRFFLTDSNSDGKHDVVTAPLGGGQPIRIWTGRSKKIAEWWPWEEHAAPAIIFRGL
ncbi:MAG: hypothetical protein A3J66_00570 [Candidatus Magasanikbacteria bacterium RIFCSPHIGHO2_02_FULL_47_14]|uniref:Peptidase S8/S53 domain-containing protein n=1 Tax=Candidatus Magasanikbacteria bacterium RIFCSPHIGHO2_02_FULL_47_14 TaxID=1798680 RepID=A0A1F6MA52_9BACT|nr:MAG: hypothetical protein A3J66_00570 [Candidatus Magasanikbacteria bacterium RIFCSPHIGHO2_02_FULL_47_14]